MLCGVHMLVISHNVMWCAHGSSNIVCLDAGPPLNPVLPDIAANVFPEAATIACS